jgi:hypothetical protein
MQGSIRVMLITVDIINRIITKQIISFMIINILAIQGPSFHHKFMRLLKH